MSELGCLGLMLHTWLWWVGLIDEKGAVHGGPWPLAPLLRGGSPCLSDSLQRPQICMPSTDAPRASELHSTSLIKCPMPAAWMQEYVVNETTLSPRSGLPSKLCQPGGHT